MSNWTTGDTERLQKPSQRKGKFGFLYFLLSCFTSPHTNIALVQDPVKYVAVSSCGDRFILHPAHTWDIPNPDSLGLASPHSTEHSSWLWFIQDIHSYLHSKAYKLSTLATPVHLCSAGEGHLSCLRQREEQTNLCVHTALIPFRTPDPLKPLFINFYFYIL